jgi:biopolymer transport protein ExbD
MLADQDLEGEVLHDINVTPFIDVILVLLIVFMIAAPLATVDIAVELPASNAARQPRPAKPVYLTIRADSSVALGETPVAVSGLASALTEVTGGDREQRIFVRADSALAYGALMNVMNALRMIGYTKVALVATEMAPAPERNRQP